MVRENADAYSGARIALDQPRIPSPLAFNNWKVKPAALALRVTGFGLIGLY